MANNVHSTHEVTGWTGWIAFAGIMMVLAGVFQGIFGLVALFQHTYYLVASSGLLLLTSYTSWGWIHLILGVVLVLAGMSLFTGSAFGRTVAVLLAVLSAIANLAFLPAYPIWSVIVIGIDILIIYAVTAHGREMTELE